MTATPVIRVGQIWREKDRRVPVPAVVLEFDGESGFVVLQRASRKTRVRVSNLRARFTLIAAGPAGASPGQETTR